MCLCVCMCVGFIYSISIKQSINQVLFLSNFQNNKLYYTMKNKFLGNSCKLKEWQNNNKENQSDKLNKHFVSSKWIKKNFKTNKNHLFTNATMFYRFGDVFVVKLFYKFQEKQIHFFLYVF